MLQERVVKRTDFEDKYGISPLTTEEIYLLLKQQNNGNDKLESNILAKKSRKAGNAQFANFDLIFKFAIEFGNHCHLFFMVRPSLF